MHKVASTKSLVVSRGHLAIYRAMYKLLYIREKRQLNNDNDDDADDEALPP